MDGFKQAKKMIMNHSFKSGGSVKARFKNGGHADAAMDKPLIKKAIKIHDKNLHGGKADDLSALKKGGKMKSGGKANCYAKGGKPAMADAKMKKGAAKPVPKAPKPIVKNIKQAMPIGEPPTAPSAPLGGSGLATAAMRKGGKAMKHGGDAKMKKGGKPKKYNMGGAVGANGGGAMTPQELLMLKKKLAMMGGGAAGAAGAMGGMAGPGAAGMGAGAAAPGQMPAPAPMPQ